MQDQKILIQMQAGKNSAFTKMYKYLPMTEEFVLKNGGNKEDALDIFQEGLLVLYKKIREKDFELTSKLSTFLYGICKYLWKNEIKKRNRRHSSEIDEGLHDDEIFNVEKQIEALEQIEIVESILTLLTERCRQILVLFYYKSLKMKEIAAKLGFKSEKIAKNQKYKCMEKAKDKLLENPSFINIKI